MRRVSLRFPVTWRNYSQINFIRIIFLRLPMVSNLSPGCVRHAAVFSTRDCRLMTEIDIRESAIVARDQRDALEIYPHATVDNHWSPGAGGSRIAYASGDIRPRHVANWPE